MPGCKTGGKKVELLLLARRPLPWQVKTRLVSWLGPEGACELYRAMAQDVWGEMLATGRRCHLASDGDTCWLPGAADYWQQPAGTYGERLLGVLLDMHQAGCAAAVALPADVPQLGSQAIELAAVRLETCAEVDLVSQPAEDGGLVLFGTRLPPPASLEISALVWETARLDRELQAMATERGLGLARILPGSYDVDAAEDVRRLLGEGPEFLARGARTKRTLGRLLGDCKNFGS